MNRLKELFLHYDGINQKYGIFFPCDVFANLDDEDLEIVD